MGEADVRTAVGGVVAALHAAGRSEGTIRRYQAVLDRFAAFLAGRGLSTASDQACVDFIARQTGTRLGALREPVTRDVQAVRRPVVLMADALAGRAVVTGRPVIPVKDGCPAGFRLLRDDYVASCRARGNAGATLVAKGKVVSRFLGYLDEMGAGDLAALGVRDVSGFLLRQRGLRRKTIAGMRSSLADFLAFLAAAGRGPQGLAGRLPPHRHLRHESEPHLWTAEEVRRLLAVIDRQSATGKRDYAMILMAARLGLRISDLRHLELGDLDWRAKTLTIIQHKTGRPLSLPLLDDVGWAVIDYVRHGRPETACAKVFIKHRHPFGAFGGSSSVACRLSRYAARAGIEFPPGDTCGMHSLRGALAVAMIGSGTPVPVVSAVLGHASSDTTQAYYLNPRELHQLGEETAGQQLTRLPRRCSGRPDASILTWEDLAVVPSDARFAHQGACTGREGQKRSDEGTRGFVAEVRVPGAVSGGFQYLTPPERFDTERLRCCALDAEDVPGRAGAGERGA